MTGPYMHDGKLKTLKDVVDFYAGKGNSNPHLDKRISMIELTGQDRSDLVEFMKSLTGELPSNRWLPGKGLVLAKNLSMIAALCLVCGMLMAIGCSRSAKNNRPVAERVQEAEIPVFHVDPLTAGSISGTVRYLGKSPNKTKIDMSEDPACVEAHLGKALDESLIVSSNGSLANAFIYVKTGLEGKRFETPSSPVVIDQNGCWFTPRVLGIQTIRFSR